MLKKFFLLILLFNLASCSQKLVVQTDYFSHQDLASFRIGTPDPLKRDFHVQQRLLISWHLKKRDFLCKNNVHIDMTIRLRNREEKSYTIPITENEGTYVYHVDQEDFENKGGILTYKVELIADGVIEEEWIHQLWVELIRFNPVEVEASSEDPLESQTPLPSKNSTEAQPL